MAAALTISTAVGEVESAASRLYKRGGASSIIIEEEIEKRCTIWRVEGRGAALIVLDVVEELDVGVLQPS